MGKYDELITLIQGRISELQDGIKIVEKNNEFQIDADYLEDLSSEKLRWEQGLKLLKE